MFVIIYRTKKFECNNVKYISFFLELYLPTKNLSTIKLATMVTVTLSVILKMSILFEK